jgi:NAD-dependent DNA ligase
MSSRSRTEHTSVWIKDAPLEDLVNTQGVGEVMGKSVYDFFKNKNNLFHN